MILPDSEKTVTITFKYNNMPIDNKVLNSYINIKFIKLFNVEYVNIDSSNLVNSIAEEEHLNIEFSNPPIDIDIIGNLDYYYNNGILSINNVTSNIKIIGKNNVSLYSTSYKNISTGSKVNPSDFQKTNDDINGVYIKYTIDSNSQVAEIEGCKTATINTNEICLSAIDSNKYNNNKELLISYFGGNNGNLPSECIEEDNYGTTEITCSNSYVVLAADDDGGIYINDLENKKSCVINPTFGIYSCK